MLYSKINALPPTLVEEFDKFIDILKDKSNKTVKIKERKFGCAKGMIVLHDDFDEPLEDFKEYL